MEITTKVIERKYAPTITADASRLPLYVRKAKLYHEVYERILALNAMYGTFFDVDYSDVAPNKTQPWVLTVQYDLGEVNVYADGGKKECIARDTVRAILAHRTADWVATRVFGG